MFKRICLLGIASFFIAGLLLATLSALLGSNASAQEENAILNPDSDNLDAEPDNSNSEPGGFNTWDNFFQTEPGYSRTVSSVNVQDLDSLALDFGATQNSLVLEIKGESGTNKINFALAGISKKTRVLNVSHTALSKFSVPFSIIDSPTMTYVADFQPNFVYQLKEDLPQTSFSLPSFCEQRSIITLTPAEEHSYEDANGYSQDWRKFDFNDKSLKAKIGLPLLNETTKNVGDDCFYLYEELDFESSDNKALFTLTGNQTFQNSCGGLKLYGRGEDDLSKAATTWFCRDDVFLEGEEKDQFSLVESPPFDSYYVFIEEGRENADDCSSRILVNKADIEEDNLALAAEWQDWHDDCKEGQYDKEKDQKRIVPLVIINTFKTDEDALTFNPGDTGDTSVSNVSNIASTCEFQASGVILGWLFCWVIKGISEALDGMEDLIYEHLTIKRSDYYLEKFPDHGKEFTLKDAWANIRNFMTFTIVGTALFMVISTALDIGFFSNYTVKKYLPRLIIGTILIQFSWALGDLLIQITNQLGDFVSALLFASFPGAEDHGLDDIFGSGGFAALLGSGSVLGLTVNAGWMVLIPTGFSALVMLFFGFLFLVFRKYLIIFMLILAPLGLALWILPGNDKAWNFYAKTFFYLLLIYPLIQLTITGGKVFSYLLIKTDDSVITTFVAFLVYALGFAAIPVLAKSFSGVLGKLTGMVNDKSKGIFDRRRKALQEGVQKRRAGRKEGKKIDRDDRVKEGANAQIGGKRFKKTRRLARRGVINPLDKFSQARERFGAGGSLRGERGGWRRARSGRRDRRRQMRQEGMEGPPTPAMEGPPTPAMEGPPTPARDYRSFSESTQMGNLEYRAARDKKYGEFVERAQSVLSGTGLGQLNTLAQNMDAPAYRRQAATNILLKAGNAGIGHVREIIDEAESRGIQGDPSLHIALQGVHKSGGFFAKNVVKAAPDLARIGFDASGQLDMSRANDLSSLYNVSTKDVVEFHDTTWAKSLGVKDIKSAEITSNMNINADMDMKVKEIVTSDVYRGQVRVDVLRAFEKMRPNYKKEYEERKAAEKAKNELEAAGGGGNPPRGGGGGNRRQGGGGRRNPPRGGGGGNRRQGGGGRRNPPRGGGGGNRRQGGGGRRNPPRGGGGGGGGGNPPRGGGGNRRQR